jgi:hypothetical protein
MTTRVRRDVHLILVIPPDDIVTLGKSHFAWLGSERRCARQSDPTLHALNTLDIFKAHPVFLEISKFDTSNLSKSNSINF